MNEQRHPLSIKAVKYRRLGSIPGAILLRACDIGIATLPDGRDVYITWGRNMTRQQADHHHLTMTQAETVICGNDHGCCEAVIPNHIANTYISLLVR